MCFYPSVQIMPTLKIHGKSEFMLVTILQVRDLVERYFEKQGTAG